MVLNETEHYRLVKRIGYGIITGIVYYIVFVYLIPYVFYSAVNIPLEVFSTRIAVFLGFFMALGIAEKIIRHPVVLALKALSKIIGITIALTILNYGKLHTTIQYENYLLNIKLDIQPVLLFLIAMSLIYGVFDAFSSIEKLEEK